MFVGQAGVPIAALTELAHELSATVAMASPISSTAQVKLDPADELPAPPPGGPEQTGDTPSMSESAALQYAPRFYFHPDEKYLPADPDAFIAHAQIKTQDGGATDLASTPENIQTLSNDYLLDLKGDDHRKGNLDAAPVLYQYEPALGDEPAKITYSLFYNYNNKAIDFMPDQNHESDWERVTLVFGDGMEAAPTEARYSAHGEGPTLPWKDVPKTESGQPVVNVAKGSHAMSPYLTAQPTKVHGIDDYFAVGGHLLDARGGLSNGGPRLQAAEDQRWWGTRIQWGENGMFDFTSGTKGPMPPDAHGENGKSSLGGTGNRGKQSLPEVLASMALAYPETSPEAIQSMREFFVKWQPSEVDELAQDFVETLARQEKLDDYAQTPFGQQVLRGFARDLEDGATHPDEVFSFKKIQAALKPYGIELGDVRQDN